MASWISQNIGCLGPNSIRAIRGILDELPPPFTTHFTVGTINLKRPKPALKVPCFFRDPEYVKESARIVGYRDRDTLKRLLKKRAEIKQKTARLSPGERNEARFILELCDERMRERVSQEDCRIRWFKKIIQQEEILLQMRALLGRRNKTGLAVYSPTFIDSFNRLSIFPFSSESREQISLTNGIREQLNRARNIVEEADARFKLAKQVYLSEHLPRPIKDAVLNICKKLEPGNINKAAALAANLIARADPQRPAKATAIRQRHYGR